MLKQKWIYILLMISVCVSSISLFIRHDVEQQTRKVELAVPYYELVTMNHGNDEQLQRLLTSGATTIVLKQSTIDELQQRHILNYYSAEDLPPELSLSTVPPDHTIFVFEPMSSEEQDYYVSWLQSVFQDSMSWINSPDGQSYMMITEPVARLKDAPLGIDIRLASQILEQYEVELVPLYMNHSLYTDQAFMEQQLTSLDALQVSHVHFGGNQVLGYPQRLSEVAQLIAQHNMHFTYIRSQLGSKPFAESMNYKLLRVIFVEPDKLMVLSAEEVTNLFELSVRERTISMIYYPFPKDHSIPTDSYVERIDASIQAITTRLSPEYEWTTAVPLAELVKDNRIIQVLSAFFGILLLSILLLRRYIINLWMTSVVIVGFVITMVLWVIESPYADLILSGYGLLGAIVGPTLSVIIGLEAVERVRAHTLSKSSTLQQLSYACLIYVMTALITLASVVLVVSLFNDISYLTYVDQFRGVKLMLIGPIGLTLLYLWRRGDIRALGSYVYRITITERNGKKSMLLLSVFLFVGLVGVYFVLRAGNEGTTLPLEAEFRSWMDSFFGVRPRTKEMLIGHPLLLVMLYSWLRFGKGRWLIVGAVIGQLSMMNTFTHLHSPLGISYTRTLLGLILGLIVGMIIILILQTVKARIIKVKGQT